MDIAMILAGVVMAMVNGVVLPLMCVVFGNMTDSFVNDAINSNINITNSSSSKFGTYCIFTVTEINNSEGI